MTCPRCQHENPTTAKFCGECGNRLGLPCPGCRTVNPPQNKFCHECGSLLAEGAPKGRFAAPHSYTPKHLAERILTSRSALEGERKQVTVFFADIQNFTGLGERLDPEELHELMDRVFAVLLEVTHRYEGTINQFTGDGVMALFGAPVALEDHALRAVQASLEIQETMAARSEEFLARLGAAPALRIGLNTGRVVVGKIGDDLRMDYTAQGDTVNLAARLQAVAEAGTVAMSPSTHRLVASYVECLSLGLRSVKGKATPVEVFRPVRRVGAASRLAVSSARGLSPFVDRKVELGRLLKLFDEVEAGEPRVAVLVGEAGIGKSRLLLEFRRQIDGAGARWFEGHCVPYGRSTPYRPIVEILRATFALTEGDPEEVALAKIEKALGEMGHQGQQIGPAVRYLLGVGPPDAGFALFSPADRKAAIRRALDKLTEHAGSQAPHVFVFEDCQWLDPASEEYLTLASQHRVPGSTLFFLTGRPDSTELLTGVLGERIALDPLAPTHAQALAKQIADSLSPDLIALIVDRTAGNPLFIEEVTRTLGETGSASIPPTVEDLLTARIDRLPSPFKSTLQTASVIGQEFTTALLQRVADDPDAVPAVLPELVALGPITERDNAPDIYRFAQPLLLEVTYEGLLNQYRKALHREIGDAIESMFPTRLLEHAEELARHFTRAEDWPRGAMYHREAGRKAAALGANSEAVKRLERALELLGRLPEGPERIEQAIDLRLELCPPMLQLGRLDEVLRLSREAESLAQRVGDEGRLGKVYAYLSNYHYMKGEPDLAIEFGQQCLAIAARPEAVMLERAARQYLGTSYHVLGAYDTAREILARHTEALETNDEFRRLGPVNLSYVSSCGWLAFTHMELGNFALAHDCAAKGADAAATGGHPYVHAIASTFQGMMWHAQGECDRAVPLLEASLDTCREHQLVVWRPIPSAVLGHAYVVLGRVQQGLDLLAESVSLTDQLGIYAYRALWGAHLAEGLLLAGQSKKALEAAQIARDLAIRDKERGNQARALQVLAGVYLRVGPGGFPQALEPLGQASEQAKALGMRPLLARCYFTLSQLAREQGDGAKADDSLTRARSLVRELGMRAWWENVENLPR
ncbi:MAG: adenylate/guanylate cyclase domain-containing protein [Candidatus Methylomirabilia bacterium]